MTDFLMGALGFLACAAAFLVGLHYGVRDRPVQNEPKQDEAAAKRAEAEKRYTENFFQYNGDSQ